MVIFSPVTLYYFRLVFIDMFSSSLCQRWLISFSTSSSFLSWAVFLVQEYVGSHVSSSRELVHILRLAFVSSSVVTVQFTVVCHAPSKLQGMDIRLTLLSVELGSGHFTVAWYALWSCRFFKDISSALRQVQLSRCYFL